MKIYTKTGDDGTTGLVGGIRVAKTDLRMAAIGDVDELNACIGEALALAGENAFEALLRASQGWLFEVGSELASDDGRYRWSQGEHVASLEASIDRQTAALPALTHFILPGGSILGARLHVARCVCRRAERSVLVLHESQAVRSEVRILLNRLSDWLFVCARTANAAQGVHDVAWVKPSGD